VNRLKFIITRHRSVAGAFFSRRAFFQPTQYTISQPLSLSSLLGLCRESYGASSDPPQARTKPPLIHVHGSKLSLHRCAKVHDLFKNVPDWIPRSPQNADIVAHAAGPTVYACAYAISPMARAAQTIPALAGLQPPTSSATSDFQKRRPQKSDPDCYPSAK